jgi:hypothetical protein
MLGKKLYIALFVFFLTLAGVFSGVVRADSIYNDPNQNYFCKDASVIDNCVVINPAETPDLGELTLVAVRKISTISLVASVGNVSLRLSMSYDKESNRFLCFYDSKLENGTIVTNSCTNGRYNQSAITDSDGVYIVDLTKLCIRANNDDSSDGTECDNFLPGAPPDIGSEYVNTWNDKVSSYSATDTFTEFTSSAQKVSLGFTNRVQNFYNWALGIGVVVALGIIVYGGLAYTASGGNESRIRDAKKWIWAAITGLMLLFGSVMIFKIINPNLLNLQDIFLEQNREVSSSQYGYVGYNVVVEGKSCPMDPDIALGNSSNNFLECRDAGGMVAPCPTAEAYGCPVSAADHRNHRGLDIRTSIGTPLYAAENGVVIRVHPVDDNDCGIGVYFTGDSGYTYGYCHMSGLIQGISQGARVNVGQQIGISGDTGNSTAPHLHISITAPESICSQDIDRKVCFGLQRCVEGSIDPQLFILTVCGNAGGQAYSQLPGGVTNASNHPDFLGAQNRSGQGVVYLCGNNNACLSGNYSVIPVFGDQTNEVESLDGTHIGDNQTSYVIIGGDVKRAVFYADANFGTPSFEINKGMYQPPSVVANYSCRTAGGCDCRNKLITLSGYNVVGINLHELCATDDNCDGSCTEKWYDEISSVKVYGGVQLPP